MTSYELPAQPDVGAILKDPKGGLWVHDSEDRWLRITLAGEERFSFSTGFSEESSWRNLLAKGPLEDATFEPCPTCGLLPNGKPPEKAKTAKKEDPTTEKAAS